MSEQLGYFIRWVLTRDENCVEFKKRLRRKCRRAKLRICLVTDVPACEQRFGVIPKNRSCTAEIGIEKSEKNAQER